MKFGNSKQKMAHKHTINLKKKAKKRKEIVMLPHSRSPLGAHFHRQSSFVCLVRFGKSISACNLIAAIFLNSFSFRLYANANLPTRDECAGIQIRHQLP